MHPRIAIRSFLVSSCVFSLILPSQTLPASQGATLAIPHELIKYGNSKGCSQVGDEFYKRKGNDGSPFAYGLIGDRTGSPDSPYYRKNSAIFWCHPKNGSGYNLLVFLRGDAVKAFSCKREIVLNEDYIFPIKVVERKWNLGNFQSVSSGGKTFKGIVKARAVIHSNDYYSTTAYMCYKGEWLYYVIAEG
jgi:hypothetical protein